MEEEHAFDYAPTDSIFPPTAVINFIPELRRAGTGQVLWVGDTLQCFRNKEGMLRYRNLPENWNVVRYLPRSGSIGRVFLSVRIASGLPHSVALSYETAKRTDFTYGGRIRRSTTTNQDSPPPTGRRAQ